MRAFAQAVAFLTILPIGSKKSAHLEHSLIYFPFVGLLIGILLAAVNAMFSLMLPSIAVAAIIMVVLIVITGGLHWDGFIDSCDALFVPRDREERLRILKDPHVGAFGLLGGLCAFISYFAFIAALPAELRTPVLILLPVVGRWIMLLAMAFFPYAREAGMGTLFGKRTPGTMIAASSFALAVAYVVMGTNFLVLTLAAVTVTMAVAYLIKRQLGGLTGDIYGALGVFVEILLLSFILFSTSRGAL